MSQILDRIENPGDIKKLNPDELKTLAGEIRERLLLTISKTGGHLGSNMGVVELTIAMHYVFNTPADKFVWDVGHQSYVHKLLTGRKDRFDTLRQYEGLSGFTKREESEHDCWNTGHGGTLSTVHANSSRETLSRIESLALLADVGLPLRAVRAQVAAAIDLVVCANRLRDGTRRITAVSEALPLDEKGDYRVQDIFVFSQTRTRRDGKVEGYLAPTAVLPTFHERLVAEGFEDMSKSRRAVLTRNSLPFFLPQSYGYDPPKHFVGTPVEVSAVNVKAATPKVPVKAPTSKRSSSSARHRDAATNHGAVQETATEQHQSDQLQRYDDAAYAQPQQAQQYYDDAAYQQQHAQQQQYYDDPRYQQYYDEQQQQQAHQQYYDDYDRQPQQQRQQQPPSRGGGGEIHDARRSGRGSGSGRGGSGRR